MMGILLAIILFIVVCGVLMFWDYYKPARFRTAYANVHKHNGTRYAGSPSWSDSDGGGDCGSD